MKTHRSTFRAALVVAAAALASGLVHAQDWTTTTDTHRFVEVRNGIYLTQTTAQVFNSNALVIVNDEDVVVVDSHVTPAKARELVTALINSHFHWDHAHGNQEFADVPIIGHEYTRMKLATAPLDEPTYVSGLAGNAARLASTSPRTGSCSRATWPLPDPRFSATATSTSGPRRWRT